MENKTAKLMHVALIHRHGNIKYLYLRRKDPYQFVWFQEDGSGKEIEASLSAADLEDAFKLAHGKWKHLAFRFLGCGYRYTLPERDEHGLNALFHQMAASYQSMNGVYYDEDLANNCIVHNASNEARDLLAKLKQENRL
jgi:hypothetical protein